MCSREVLTPHNSLSDSTERVCRTSFNDTEYFLETCQYEGVWTLKTQFTYIASWVIREHGSKNASIEGMGNGVLTQKLRKRACSFQKSTRIRHVGVEGWVGGMRCQKEIMV